MGKTDKLLPVDAARDLTDDAAVAESMSVVLQSEDPDLLLPALGLGLGLGLGREHLYKALAPGAKPRFDTVTKVAKALGSG